MSLSSLPNELRALILSCLRRDGCSQASLAATSRDWQDLIEPQAFARVALTPSRLPMFKVVAPRKRHLIRAIWFRIDLRLTDRWLTRDINCEIIQSAFESLFSTLSSWDPSEGDLALDLSFVSSWDADPCFAHIPLKPDLTRVQCQQDQELRPGAKPAHAPAPTALQLEKAFSEIPIDFIDSESTEEPFPSVPAITSLVLRQQSRLQWPDLDLGHLLSHMPSLQQIHYEPWRALSADGQWVLDEGYSNFIAHIFTPGLRRLVLSEVFNEQYLAIMQASSPRRYRCRGLHASFAQRSINFEILSISFITEASIFFGECKPSWVWPNLTSLTLTSQLLTTSSDSNIVLKMGAEVAVQMPKLEIMEIWNGGSGLAGMFQYRSKPSVITWTGTWGLTFHTSTIQAWKYVASTNGTELYVVHDMLDESKIKCLGDALYHLGHSERVLRPVSLQQARIPNP